MPIRTTEDELRAFAQAEIGERPAWPKEILIIDAIPMTAVDKIFKPSLRAVTCVLPRSAEPARGCTRSGDHDA